jgi:hypothetical protein
VGAVWTAAEATPANTVVGREDTGGPRRDPPANVEDLGWFTATRSRRPARGGHSWEVGVPLERELDGLRDDVGAAGSRRVTFSSSRARRGWMRSWVTWSPVPEALCFGIAGRRRGKRRAVGSQGRLHAHVLGWRESAPGDGPPAGSRGFQGGDGRGLNLSSERRATRPAGSGPKDLLLGCRSSLGAERPRRPSRPDPGQ